MATAGYSLIETMVVVSLLLTMCGVAAPRLLASLDDARAAGAARYMAARLNEARMEAVKRSAHVAIRFVLTSDGYRFATYLDANGNGVRTREIEAGVDRPIRAPEYLSHNFKGVEFGTLPELPPVDSGSQAPGADPLKIGGSDILAFTGVGTSTSASLYLRGAGQAQYVVRVVGQTGRVRILRFDARTHEWKPL